MQGRQGCYHRSSLLSISRHHLGIIQTTNTSAEEPRRKCMVLCLATILYMVRQANRHAINSIGTDMLTSIVIYPYRQAARRGFRTFERKKASSNHHSTHDSSSFLHRLSIRTHIHHGRDCSSQEGRIAKCCHWSVAVVVPLVCGASRLGPNQIKADGAHDPSSPLPCTR